MEHLRNCGLLKVFSSLPEVSMSRDCTPGEKRRCWVCTGELCRPPCCYKPFWRTQINCSQSCARYYKNLRANAWRGPRMFFFWGQTRVQGCGAHAHVFFSHNHMHGCHNQAHAWRYLGRSANSDSPCTPSYTPPTPSVEHMRSRTIIVVMFCYVFFKLLSLLIEKFPSSRKWHIVRWSVSFWRSRCSQMNNLSYCYVVIFFTHGNIYC